MMKKYLMALVVALLCVNSVGCETMPTSPTSLTPPTAQPEAVKYVANFVYTPSSQAVPLSGGVTFAIGDVVHGRDPNVPSWIGFEQFANLDKAIAQDLPELLTAKGFSVRGPFDSTDLIPYSDKKDIDFLLVPVIELFITLKDNKAEKVVSSLPPPPMFNFTGNAEVSGKMRVELRETVTNELMWAKSIPFTNTFPYNVSISGYINESQYYVEASRVPFKYGLIMDDVAKGMEKEYPNLMATVSKLIDPEEMRIIRKQAQELKSKKGY